MIKWMCDQMHYIKDEIINEHSKKNYEDDVLLRISEKLNPKK